MASKYLPVHSFLLRPVAYGVPLLSPASEGDSGDRAWPEWNGFELLASRLRRAPAGAANVSGWSLGNANPAAYSAASNEPGGSACMTSVTLSASPKGNGFQATITYADGIAVSSAEAFPTESEAISAAAMKLLEMPERLEGPGKPNWDD